MQFIAGDSVCTVRKKIVSIRIGYGINEEQITTGYPIDGAMGSSGSGRVLELSVVC